MTKKEIAETLLDKFKKDFDLLAYQVRDYHPETFDRLRKNFFHSLQDRYFKKNFCDKCFKEGQSPARKWLEIHNYPISALDVKLLRSLRGMTDESKKIFLTALNRYFLMHDNSAAFRNKIDAQEKAGINSFLLWMEKQGVKLVYKDEVDVNLEVQKEMYPFILK